MTCGCDNFEIDADKNKKQYLNLKKFRWTFSTNQFRIHMIGITKFE